jgi:hypothetical protein
MSTEQMRRGNFPHQSLGPIIMPYKPTPDISRLRATVSPEEASAIGKQIAEDIIKRINFRLSV